MAIYSTSSSASGIRIVASGSNSGHTILDGVALESTNDHLVEFSGGDGSLTVGGYAIGSGAQYAVSIRDGAQDIIVNILESGHLFGGGILTVTSSELIRVNFINAGNVYANDVGYSGSAGVDIIINSGFLGASAGFAIDTGGGDDKVYNSGTIQGNVQLGNDNDLYNGRGGTVIGDVQGGFGDDTFIVDDATLALVEFAAQGTDTVKSTVNYSLGDHFENLKLLTGKNIGGTGNELANTLVANSGANRLAGLAGADTIDGKAGDDLLLGGGGVDSIIGGQGDDIVRGGSGTDTLSGNNGDDVLRGGTGDDILGGGDGNDTLNGGAGKDKLRGGDGADDFVFSRAGQSTNDGNADIIADFTLGIDIIDLSALPGKLDFIGSAEYSGSAAEVRVHTSGSNSIVRVDVNGDGSADMKIKVRDVTGLDAADFLL